MINAGSQFPPPNQPPSNSTPPNASSNPAGGVPIFNPPAEDQTQIVAICQQLKTIWRTHATDKKYEMQRAYAYSQSKFFGDNDLLPLPSSDGQDRDNNPNRPQVFFPISRQQHKMLFTFLKLTLFPNDEDYFVIKAKTYAAANALGPNTERDLTEAVKYVFKEQQIPRKLGNFLKNLVDFGFAVAYPTFGIDPKHEWGLDLANQQAVSQVNTQDKSLEIENWNPLHFYVDPIARNEKEAKWAYFTVKKLQQILDCPYYINKDKLEAIAISTPQENDPLEPGNVRQFEGVDTIIIDTDKSLYIDHYFFPHIKLPNGHEYRNIFVSVASNQVLIECRPNLTPKGNSPAIYHTWQDEVNSPYGLGPMEEMADLQRLLNLVGNYLIETMARCGNRFAISENVDMASWYGVAGGYAVCPEPGKDIIPMTGNLAELDILGNFMQAWQTQMQTLSGAQAPFPESSNVDFKAKTATEVSVNQENTVSISREVTEHAATGVQKILQQCLFLLPMLYDKPVEIRVDDPMMGTRFLQANFNIFQSGDYVIELIGANPSQSKQQQQEMLMQFAQTFMANPQGVMMAKPIFTQIAATAGIKNFDDLMNQLTQNAQMLQQQQMQQQMEMQQHAAQAQQQQAQNVQGGGFPPAGPHMGGPHMPPPGPIG